MKVLFVTDSPEVWGAERSLLAIAVALRDRGNEIAVMAPSRSPLLAHLQVAGVRAVVKDLPEHPALLQGGLAQAGWRDRLRELSAIWKSGKAIAQEARHWDAVVSFSLWRNADVLLASKIAGVRAVADVHESFNGRLGALMSGLTLSQFGLVVAPSRWIAAQSRAPRRTVRVIPRIADSHWIAGLPDREYTVGIFGQLRKHKGHDLLIEAALRASDCCAPRVLIVGSGGDEETRGAVTAAVENYPDVFTHKERTDDPVRVMAECAAVINVSEHEAFGRTMIEAVSAGAEPVAAGEGGPSEILRALGFGTICDRSVEGVRSVLEGIEQSGRHAANRTERLLKLEQYAGPGVVAEMWESALSVRKSIVAR